MSSSLRRSFDGFNTTFGLSSYSPQRLHQVSFTLTTRITLDVDRLNRSEGERLQSMVCIPRVNRRQSSAKSQVETDLSLGMLFEQEGKDGTMKESST